MGGVTGEPRDFAFRKDTPVIRMTDSNTPADQPPADQLPADQLPPAATTHESNRTQIIDNLIESMTSITAEFVGVSTDRAKALAERTIARTEVFIAEHSDSPNFFELAQHLAAQSANDAIQVGLSLNTEAQIRLRAIALSIISALRFVLV